MEIVNSTSGVRPKDHCKKIGDLWIDIVETLRTKELTPISFGGSNWAYIQREFSKGKICYLLRHIASPVSMFGYWPSVHPSRRNEHFDRRQNFQTLAAAEVELGKLK